MPLLFFVRQVKKGKQKFLLPLEIYNSDTAEYLQRGPVKSILF